MIFWIIGIAAVADALLMWALARIAATSDEAIERRRRS